MSAQQVSDHLVQTSILSLLVTRSARSFVSFSASSFDLVRPGLTPPLGQKCARLNDADKKHAATSERKAIRTSNLVEELGTSSAINRHQFRAEIQITRFTRFLSVCVFTVYHAGV